MDREIAVPSWFPGRHGFFTTDDPHGRWWRTGRFHRWFGEGRRLPWGDVGAEWVTFHRTLNRVGLKVSTTGEETLDVALRLGPLAQVWLKTTLGPVGGGREYRLPGVRFEFQVGLTGCSWCIGQDSHDWARNAPLSERLRRNHLTWWRVGWHQLERHEVTRVRSEVCLPEARVPVSVALERSTWGLQVGPYSLSRRTRRKGLRFAIPGPRRVRWSTTVSAPEGGLTHPGKGENSWDCGQDSISMMCSPLSRPPYDDRDMQWVAEAVANVTKSLYRSRVRHGGGIADTGA